MCVRACFFLTSYWSSDMNPNAGSNHNDAARKLPQQYLITYNRRRFIECSHTHTHTHTFSLWHHTHTHTHSDWCTQFITYYTLTVVIVGFRLFKKKSLSLQARQVSLRQGNNGSPQHRGQEDRAGCHWIRSTPCSHGNIMTPAVLLCYLKTNKLFYVDLFTLTVLSLFL